jgi:predicted small secreted protein
MCVVWHPAVSKLLAGCNEARSFYCIGSICHPQRFNLLSHTFVVCVTAPQEVWHPAISKLLAGCNPSSAASTYTAYFAPESSTLCPVTQSFIVCCTAFNVPQEVWHPAISKLLAGCTLLSPWRRFYGLGSTWQHYEEAAAAGQLPEGLLPLADSICSFQPVYGQGMTVAALEAEMLDKLLTQRSTSSSSSSSSMMSSQQLGGLTEKPVAHVLQLSGLAAELQAAVQPTVQAAWDLAVGGDMKFEGAVSSDGAAGGGLAGKLAAGYQDALFELATCDETVSEQSQAWVGTVFRSLLLHGWCSARGLAGISMDQVP